MRYGVKAFLLVMGLSVATNAAHLEDVRILSFNPGEQDVAIKLQAKEAPAGSYFIVDIVKSDADSFDKLAMIMSKLAKKDKYRLDLEIPNFSISPSGSYYKSDGIAFIEVLERDPSAVKSQNQKSGH